MNLAVSLITPPPPPRKKHRQARLRRPLRNAVSGAWTL